MAEVEMVVEKLADGAWRGRVPSLPGCEAIAASRSALREEMREAVAAWGEVGEFVEMETVRVDVG